MPKTPEPDDFGRYRVETDTGAKVSVNRAPLAGEKVLDEDASDIAGDALPVEYPDAKSTAPSGQQAGTDKENAHG